MSVAALACVALAAFICPTASGAGTIAGWGYNARGQLGNGGYGAGSCECVAAPAPVSGIDNAIEVSGGYDFAAALLADGTVRAWGKNTYGQLGDGSGTKEQPVPVTVLGVSGAKQIAAGGYGGYALLGDGTVMAWGANDYGQVGLGFAGGPETCEGDCVKVARKIPGLSNVVAVGAGANFGMALLADGTVDAWGYDYNGELGNGLRVEATCHCVPTPTPILGLSNVVSLAGGYYQAGAVLGDGSTRFWGSGEYGQLGDGKVLTGGCECEPPVAQGLSGAVEVDSGEYDSFALLADGTARAWGYNSAGELGIGTSTASGCYCISVPTPVFGLGGVRQIAAGEQTGLALLDDGTVRAWGPNYVGQNGDGGTSEADAPVAVSSISGVSQISAGERSAYALIGPSQTLSVGLAGAGSGSVGGRGILCPPACTHRFAEGTNQVLRATTAAGFAGFSGACSGTGPCSVVMGSDQAVTATFGPASGTKIDKAKISSKKRSASFSFSAPGAITGYECKLVRPAPPKKKHGAKRSATRKKPSFAACAGPKAYKGLRPGRYSFAVRALDSLGPDAHPAVKKFKIVKPRRKHRH